MMTPYGRLLREAEIAKKLLDAALLNGSEHNIGLAQDRWDHADQALRAHVERLTGEPVDRLEKVLA